MSVLIILNLLKFKRMLIICIHNFKNEGCQLCLIRYHKKGLVYWEKGSMQRAAMELWLHVRRC